MNENDLPEEPIRIAFLCVRCGWNFGSKQWEYIFGPTGSTTAAAQWILDYDEYLCGDCAVSQYAPGSAPGPNVVKVTRKTVYENKVVWSRCV